MNLSLNFYTQWYWKIDLLNLLHFVWLRSDAHAQYEIRAYADVLLDVIRRWVPLTYDAFMDYRVNAASISGPALAVLRRMLNGEAGRSGIQRPRQRRVARAHEAAGAPDVIPAGKHARFAVKIVDHRRTFELENDRPTHDEGVRRKPKRSSACGKRRVQYQH